MSHMTGAVSLADRLATGLHARGSMGSVCTQESRGRTQGLSSVHRR